MVETFPDWTAEQEAAITPIIQAAVDRYKAASEEQRAKWDAGQAAMGAAYEADAAGFMKEMEDTFNAADTEKKGLNKAQFVSFEEMGEKNFAAKGWEVPESPKDAKEQCFDVAVTLSEGDRVSFADYKNYTNKSETKFMELMGAW